MLVVMYGRGQPKAKVPVNPWSFVWDCMITVKPIVISNGNIKPYGPVPPLADIAQIA